MLNTPGLDFRLSDLYIASFLLEPARRMVITASTEKRSRDNSKSAEALLQRCGIGYRLVNRFKIVVDDGKTITFHPPHRKDKRKNQKRAVIIVIDEAQPNA